MREGPITETRTPCNYTNRPITSLATDYMNIIIKEHDAKIYVDIGMGKYANQKFRYVL